MRFVFITDELPIPGSAGHLALNHAIIGWLQGLGHRVTVLLVRPRLRSPIERYPTAEVAGIGIRYWRGLVFTTHLRAGMGMVARIAAGFLPAAVAGMARDRQRKKLYGQVDAVLGAFVTPTQASWCAAWIASATPDVILVDTLFRATVLRDPALARIRSVIITHDLFHLRHQALRRAGYRVHPAELTAAAEAGLLALADAIVAIQPDEAAAFRGLCPTARVCTAPMPAAPCGRPREIRRIADRLVFVGSAALPNLDGLRWFFAEVWPRVTAARPLATLDLVGDCGAAFAVLPPGVNRLGRVAKLSAVLHRAALAISPLRVGSGLKIKMLDYARHGLVTVATAESLAGFAADANAPFTLAEDAASFAGAVVAILSGTDPASEQRALDYVTTHYDVESSFAGLADVLGMPRAADATAL